MASALEMFQPKHVLFVSSRDGLDELSITAPTDVIELKDGERGNTPFHPKISVLQMAELKIYKCSHRKRVPVSFRIFLKIKAAVPLYLLLLLMQGRDIHGGDNRFIKGRNGAGVRDDYKRSSAARLERLKQKEEEIYA